MNNDLLQIRHEVEWLRLRGRASVLDMPIEELKKCYNGTGPEFLPAPIRAKLDNIASTFLPAVMVHDVDYTLSDGSIVSFRRANRRLLLNCLTCARSAYPWTSWRLYALFAEAFVIYRACRKFGWIAWLLAYNKNTNLKGINHE